MEILESPHTMVIDGGYFVEDRKYFTISNNTPLDANLSINLSSKMFEPIERINLPLIQARQFKSPLYKTKS